MPGKSWLGDSKTMEHREYLANRLNGRLPVALLFSILSSKWLRGTSQILLPEVGFPGIFGQERGRVKSSF